MSVLLTVSIAIAAFLVCCLIGLYFMKPKKKKPINDADCPVVLIKAVLDNVLQMTDPEREYNKRVNAALRKAVNKVIDVWVIDQDKDHRRSLANELYHKWHYSLLNISYCMFDPEYPYLTIIGRHRLEDGFRFDAYWSKKP